MSKRKQVICPECGPDSPLAPNAGRGLCSMHYHRWRRAKIALEQDQERERREITRKRITGEEPWSLKEFMSGGY